MQYNVLLDRAAMMADARAFFHARGVVEVDCPLITQGSPIDEHIDPIAVVDGNKYRYLITSPEYCMKRLIAAGAGDIYQLAHVFRYGESSSRHNPEFMMAEWYRKGFSFDAMVQETLDFIEVFLGTQKREVITYREAFQKYASIDYVKASIQDLCDLLSSQGITPYDGIEAEGKDAVLNIAIGALIEPHLGKDGLCALTHYPATQAALALTCQRDDENVAERFEIYYHGIELANGYHELADSTEQHERFIESNKKRVSHGKSELPIDTFFLEALGKLPDCCGVAVGFDRLMMLRHNASIEEVIPFSWNHA